MSAAPPLIALAGNIGVGKSTVAKHLAVDLGLPLWEESVLDNPFLVDFYADMPTWVFHLNMYFLASRADQLRRAAPNGGVFDRSLPEDEIFVRLALEDGVTTPQNVQVFESLFDTLLDLLPRLDLLLYLEADPSTLHERVEARHRDFEGPRLDLSYLARLQNRYDEWIAGYKGSPTLHVDTTALDLRARDSVDTRELIAQVRQSLAM